MGRQAVAIGAGKNENESGTSQIESTESADSEPKLDGVESDGKERSQLKARAGKSIGDQKAPGAGAKRTVPRDAKGRWASSTKPPTSLVSAKTARPTRNAAAKKADPTKEEAAKAQATVVKKLLKKMERKLGGKDAKASLGDYIRLVQLQKELDEDTPREIKVTWVETGTQTTEGEAKPDTTSLDTTLLDTTSWSGE